MRASATILAILLTTAGPALAGFLRSTKPAGIDGCPVGWERYHDDGTEGHDSCFTEQLLKQDASWEDAVLSCMEAHEGAHLMTIASTGRPRTGLLSAFLSSQIVSGYGAFGCVQAAASSEQPGAWGWLDGSPAENLRFVMSQNKTSDINGNGTLSLWVHSPALVEVNSCRPEEACPVRVCSYMSSSFLSTLSDDVNEVMGGLFPVPARDGDFPFAACEIDLPIA